MTAADAAVALWLLVPLIVVHLFLRRRRELFRFQLVVDLFLLLLPGRIMLSGQVVAPPSEATALRYAVAVGPSNPEQVDLAEQFVPWAEEVRRLLREGEPPWISERIGGGAPLFAASQSGFPFPLQAPTWALGAERASGVTVVWKLELAALGAFLFCRRLRLTAAASAVTALAYAFGLYSLSWVTMPLGWPHALLPFAWLGMLGALGGSRRALAATGLLLGGLAGWGVNSEVGALVWLSLVPLVVVRARRDRSRWRRALAVLALGVAIAAVGAVPAVVTIADSAKFHEGVGHSLYPAPGVTWGVRTAALAHLVAPWRGGHPAAGPVALPFPVCVVSWTIGGAGLTMAVLGWRCRRRPTLRAAWLALGLAAAVLVFQVPLLSQLLSRVPLLGSMTWARAGFLLVWALAGLAGLGCQRLQRERAAGALLASALVVQGLVLAARLSGAAPFAPGALLTEALVAPGLLFAGAIGRPHRRRALAVVTVVAAELMVLGWSVLPRSSPLDRGRSPAWLGSLAGRHGVEGGRVLGAGHAFPANYPALYGFADLRSKDAVRSRAAARVHLALGSAGMDLPGPVTTPWAGLAGAWGVRWLVTPPGGLGGPATAAWQEAYADADARIFRNPRALDEVRVAGRTVAPPGDAGNGSWETIDFATTAVVEEPIAVAGSGRLEVLERRPARTTARIEASGTVLAILHVPRAPGWAATLDGRPVPLIEANLGAMAVAVPEGVHEVRWAYQPPGVMPGAGITLVGLLACGMLALTGSRRRTRR